MPIPRHPLLPKYDRDIPAAKRVQKTLVALPLFPDLTDAEVDYVVEASRAFDRVEPMKL